MIVVWVLCGWVVVSLPFGVLIGRLLKVSSPVEWPAPGSHHDTGDGKP